MRVNASGHALKLTQCLDTFKGGQSEPAPTPNVPAAGEPLLNQSETAGYNKFFEILSNEDLLPETFTPFATPGQHHLDAITSVHAAFSSLPPLHNGSSDASFSEHLFRGPDYSAASTLVDSQNGGHLSMATGDFFGSPTSHTSHAPNQNNPIDLHRPLNFPPSSAFDTLASTSHATRQSGLEPPSNQGISSEADQFLLSEFQTRSRSQARRVFGQPGSESRRALTFGSDSAFQTQYYAPPDNLEGVHVAEGRAMGLLAGLEPQHSANNTQPSSPILSKKKREHAALDDPNASFDGEDSGEEGRVRHKRQCLVKGEGALKRNASSAMRNPPKTSGRDRRRNSSEQSQNGMPTKDHQRQNSDGRVPRQNLTEEEKKKNHIQSEQKRRTQIRDAFNDLVRLLPESAAAGPSKCVILTQVVEWLTSMIEGNRSLRAQLESLGGKLP